MRYTDICEELEVKTDIERINESFRSYIEQVFSPVYLKKIDRVFKKPLLVETFDKKGNVMALTSPEGTISVNSKMFNDLPVDRAMVYIIHELFHVLQNKSQFSEIKTVNKQLGEKTLKKVPKKNISRFLTGKQQDIHSNYKDEFLSYCSNCAFDWSMAEGLRDEYYRTLKNSGLFNIESDWWRARFGER